MICDTWFSPGLIKKFISFWGGTTGLSFSTFGHQEACASFRGLFACPSVIVVAFRETLRDSGIHPWGHFFSSFRSFSPTCNSLTALEIWLLACLLLVFLQLLLTTPSKLPGHTHSPSCQVLLPPSYYLPACSLQMMPAGEELSPLCTIQLFKTGRKLSCDRQGIFIFPFIFIAFICIYWGYFLYH